MSNDGDGWATLKGRLIVLSGPSGSGKSTLAKRLLGRPHLRLKVSISATTRSPRPGEEDGREYFFVSAEQFEKIRPELLERPWFTATSTERQRNRCGGRWPRERACCW